MPYLWEQPNMGDNLYERAMMEATFKGFKLTDKGKNPAIQKWVEGKGGKYNGPTESSPNGTVMVDVDSDEGQELVAGLKNNGAISVDNQENHGNLVKAHGDNQENSTNSTQNNTGNEEKSESDGLLDTFVKSVQEEMEKKGILGNTAQGLINMVKDKISGKKSNIPDSVIKLAKDDPAKAADVLANGVKSGQLKVDNPTQNAPDANPEKNPADNEPQAPNASMPETVKMPPLFETEPDDSMWQDIVVTEFGIPMINMGNPVAKKVLASDNPEQDCPGDLKQFKKAVYEDPRLQKVFGKGGLGRIVGGKLTNLLTLGIAGATTDAGKRADRIVKELKEKGGMTTHRNLLMVNYKDIMNADPSSDSPVKVKPYNRSKGQFLGELDVPGTMLAQFYSCVDPKGSPKIYIDMLSKDNSPLENTESANTESAYIQADPLVEGPIKNVINAIKSGDNENSNEVNRDKEGKQGGNDEIKNAFISYMSNNGYPPMYVLKPKSANKEVVVVSTGSTGQFYGGKVNMVTLKIGEHQAAAFMTPKEIKQYFAL